MNLSIAKKTLAFNKGFFKKVFNKCNPTQFIFKRTFFMKALILFFVCSIGFISTVHAQCSGVTVEAFPLDPQSGQYNYFGVRVTLAQAYSQDVTVAGYIHKDVDEENNQDHPFTLTVAAGSLTAETDPMFYQTDPTSGAAVTVSSVSPCPNYDITATYAGVTITYEVLNHILKFNNASDFNTVVDQLETDYDTYNDNYDIQYPNLTPEQMDDMDAANNFDEFRPFKDFENLFSGFSSKRAAIENTENAWLGSGFTTTDPDDIDLTFDDALNTIFNADNSFKVGSDLYQLAANGLYINGNLHAIVKPKLGNELSFASNKELRGYEMYINTVFYNGNADLGPTCKTNKKSKGFAIFGNDRYKLKVSITSLSIRSGVRSKVVHYVSKNGSWKRSRAKMSVSCAGNIYNPSCNQLFSFSDRNPSPNGWKKRRQLKVNRHDWTVEWKTNPGEIVGGFETEVGNSGVLSLTW